MEQVGVMLVSVAISMATFIYTLVIGARKANNDKVDRLERKLDAVETRLTECEEDRQDLREKILTLQADRYSSRP